MLSRGGYWIEPLPAIAARDGALPAGAGASLRDQRLRPEAAPSRPHARRSTARTWPRGSSAAASGSSPRRRCRSSCRSCSRRRGRRRNSPPRAKKNRAVVASSRARSWLPTYRIKRAGAKPGRERPLVQCRNVRSSPEFSGLGMLTVLTVDLAKGLEPVDSTAVMTDGRIVYASPESLYVATERWADRPDPEQADDGEERRPHRDPQVRHLEPAADAVPRQRRRRRLSAQPVVALRAQGRPARRQHREPGVVGAPAAPSPSRS